MAGTLRAFTTVTLLAALLVMAGTGAVQAFTLQTSFAGIGECTAPGTTTTTTDPAVRPLAEQSRRPASTAGLGAVGATDLDRSSTSSPTQTPAFAPKRGAVLEIPVAARLRNPNISVAERALLERAA